MGSDPKERRASTRTDTNIEVVISAGRDEGVAILSNVSAMGALLEPATAMLPLGSPMTIRVPATRDHESEIVQCIVVRHTQNGLGVRFAVYSTAVARLIEEHAKRIDPT